MSQSFDVGLTPEESFKIDLNVSGGTDNYEKLKNLPTLNGVEIKGDLTSVDVGVVGRDEIPPLEEIATKSEIPDVSGFAVKSEVDVALAEKQDKGDYALTSQLPTKTSQLVNDSDFVSTSELPTKTSQLENDSGFLTKHQDISNLATKAELSNKADKTEVPTKTSQLENDIGFLTQHQDISNLATKAELSNKANKSDVPTKTSQLENDSGFLTEHQDISGLATKAELNSKADKSEIPTKTSQLENDSGFLTQHQDVSNLATKSELQAVQQDITSDYAQADSELQQQINGQAESITSLSQNKADKGEIPDVSGFAVKSEVDVALAEKQNKVNIETLSSSQTLVNNTVFRGGEIASLELLIPTTVDTDFICEVDFTSGETATAFTMVDTVKWTGDDITDGSFVPEASKRYNLMFWYDGVNFNAISRGV